MSNHQKLTEKLVYQYRAQRNFKAEAKVAAQQLLNAFQLSLGTTGLRSFTHFGKPKSEFHGKPEVTQQRLDEPNDHGWLSDDGHYNVEIVVRLEPTDGWETSQQVCPPLEVSIYCLLGRSATDWYVIPQWRQNLQRVTLAAIADLDRGAPFAAVFDRTLREHIEQAITEKYPMGVSG